MTKRLCVLAILILPYPFFSISSKFLLIFVILYFPHRSFIGLLYLWCIRLPVQNGKYVIFLKTASVRYIYLNISTKYIQNLKLNFWGGGCFQDFGSRTSTSKTKSTTSWGGGGGTNPKGRLQLILKVFTSVTSVSIFLQTKDTLSQTFIPRGKLNFLQSSFCVTSNVSFSVLNFLWCFIVTFNKLFIISCSATPLFIPQ